MCCSRTIPHPQGARSLQPGSRVNLIDIKVVVVEEEDYMGIILAVKGNEYQTASMNPVHEPAKQKE